MRRSAYSDDQIRAFVHDLLQGRPAGEICAVAGISSRTLFRWRRKFGGLKPFAVQALRQLEQENRRLRSAMVQRGQDPSLHGSPIDPVRLRDDLGTLGVPSTAVGHPARVMGRYAALRVR